jgi:hypothetical protein
VAKKTWLGVESNGHVGLKSATFILLTTCFRREGLSIVLIPFHIVRSCFNCLRHLL